MLEVKLHYPKYKQYESSITYKEATTHAAVIDLFLRGIHVCQTSATRIVFESERDRTLGLLILSEGYPFKPQCIVASKS